MDEENDDQWLYGEDSSSDKPSGTENAAENFPNKDLFSAKSQEAFMNPTEDGDDCATDLEPPIIKPLDANTFDNDAPPPGEEEILVPPFIPAPDTTNEKDESTSENQTAVNGDANEGEGDEEKSDRKLSEGEEEDDEDDNIQVVIRDTPTTPNYNATLHIKRGNLLTLTKPGAGGKFAVDDFESVGIINGVPAHEFNLDNLEEKPWRKPGADITDFFNYGFNEDTWRAYCERQKRIRVHESGSGLIPMNTSNNVNIIPNVSVPPPNMMMPPVGVPPPDMNPGNINVIGNANNRRSTDVFAKENTIQVMTADRREYSKKNFTPDLSVPPPAVVPPPFGAIPPGMPPPFPPMNQYGPPPGEYFTPEMDPYYQSYEAAQEPNWVGQSTNWSTTVQIPISNGNTMNTNPDHKPPISDNGPPGVKIKIEPEDRDVSRDRDRDRARDYDRERDSRHRDRSHRHRSRSRSHERRSRKHKSRSRSPGYRSHKKKKSKKSERSKSDSD